MIRVHKNRTTPEAISDMLRLNLGDVLENRHEIPMSTTFDEMYLASNQGFKDWLKHIIQVSLFFESMSDSERDSFSSDEINALKIDEALIQEVFFILGSETREDFVSYRHNLIAESMKPVPQIVEVE